MENKIQLIVDNEALDVLENLKKETSATSIAEVISDAVGVYNSLKEILKDDNKKLAIIYRKEGEFQELLVPSFTRASIVLGNKIKRVFFDD